MKKKAWLVLIFVFFMSGLLSAEETIKAVVAKIPDDPAAAKNKLLLQLSQLQALADEMAADVVAANIELVNMQDVNLVTLGSVKKGKIKWNHKTGSDKFLLVEFAPGDYALLSEKIKGKALRPGVQLTISDVKTRSVVKSQEITFCDFAELQMQLKYPVKAAPGQSLAPEVEVSIENTGSAPAENVSLEIVLSSDNLIPNKPAVISDQFAEDVRLGDGLEIIPRLEPGQKLTVMFKGSLKIPADTPPGKYYLAVVADPENRVVEINESNNIESGFILLSVPEPTAFVVEMPETEITFIPADYGFRITCQAAALSDGKDWKLCKMKANLYQIQHVSWNDYYWEIDTYEKAAWEIKGAPFCKKGGKARDLDIKVGAKGGSLLIPPASFTLKLPRTQMRFEPATRKFTLVSHDSPIFHLPFWWVCKREAHLYQIRYVLWENYFWQVDTFKKQVSLVSGGKFCSSEGTPTALPLQVAVEN